LAEFIGDITRIFENCRYLNFQGTGVAKAAENLEIFLGQEIEGVREKMTHQQTILQQNQPVPLRSSDVNHKNLNKARVELVEQIGEKRKRLEALKDNCKEITDTKSAEIKNLESMLEKCHSEKNIEVDEVDKLDKELSDLETRMTSLKQKKGELLQKGKINDEMIRKNEDKIRKLKGDFDEELKISQDKESKIKEEILDLETKLQEIQKLVENLPDKNKLFFEPNKELLEFIDDQISEKERELECPVCLDVACSPIFMCSDQHLICSNCRPKLSNCPECRMEYRGKSIRHRYAEKTAEELERLKNKKNQVS